AQGDEARARARYLNAEALKTETLYKDGIEALILYDQLKNKLITPEEHQARMETILKRSQALWEAAAAGGRGLPQAAGATPQAAAPPTPDVPKVRAPAAVAQGLSARTRLIGTEDVTGSWPPG